MTVPRHGPTGHTLATPDDDRCEVTTDWGAGKRDDVRCLLKPHDPETGHLGDTRGGQRFRWWPLEDGEV